MEKFYRGGAFSIDSVRSGQAAHISEQIMDYKALQEADNLALCEWFSGGQRSCGAACVITKFQELSLIALRLKDTGVKRRIASTVLIEL